MKNSIMAAIALTILAFAGKVFAVGTTVTNGQGARLEIETPVIVYLHTSVPFTLQATIVEAINEVNLKLGEETVELEGIYIAKTGYAADGKNVLSLSNSWDPDRSAEHTRLTAYWTGERITELDLLINGQYHDLEASPAELKASIVSQFEKLFSSTQ